jgi:hypothetical protein
MVFLVKDNLKDALRRFRLPAQQKSAKNSAEEFLRYWERICLCLDYCKEGDVIPHNEAKLVRDVGRRGQEDYERYIRLVQRQDLQLPISSNSASTNETVLLLANLEQRRKELQTLWGHHATREGKARVAVNSRLLWIDAICINQADLDERIAQIKIMRQIYQRAHSVLIWLGDDDGDGGTAIELLSRIGQKLRSRQGEIAMPANSAIDEIGVSAPWYSLAFFFSSPWFQRSWVVQECVASARSRNTPPMLYYGPRCISWDVLDDLMLDEHLCLEKVLELVAETWKFHPRRYPWNGDVFGFDFGNPGQQDTCMVRHEIGQSFYTGFTEWLRLRATLVETDTSEKDIRCNLVFWLMRIRARQATNPLDKIYSVLGLVQDLQGNGDSEDATLDALIVDYRASVEDVYSSLVRAIVVKTKNLRILAACTTRGPLIQRSWTPDWTQPREWDLATYDLMVQDTDLTTGFDASSGRECNALFADDLSTLSAEGIFWDTISFKTTTVDRNVPNKLLSLNQGHLPETLPRELLDIWDRSIRGSVYPDEDVRNLGLWRTLVARFSIYIDRPHLYKDYPPSTTWVPQFRRALEASKAVDINILPMLGVLSELGQTSLDTPENIIRTLKLAIGNLMAWGHAVLATEKGFIGEATNRCQVGDIVCVLLGCNYPVILRPIGGHYELVATVYLHDIMHGEVIQAMEEGKVQSQVFELH